MSSCPENFSQNADDRPRSADRTRSPAAVFQKWEYFKYPPEQRRGQSPRGGPPSFLTSTAMLRRLPQRDGVNLMTARIVKETGRVHHLVDTDEAHAGRCGRPSRRC